MELNLYTVKKSLFCASNQHRIYYIDSCRAHALHRIYLFYKKFNRARFHTTTTSSICLWHVYIIVNWTWRKDLHTFIFSLQRSNYPKWNIFQLKPLITFSRRKEKENKNVSKYQKNWYFFPLASIFSAYITET